jgi:hypothetical protein
MILPEVRRSEEAGAPAIFVAGLEFLHFPIGRMENLPFRTRGLYPRFAFC